MPELAPLSRDDLSQRALEQRKLRELERIADRMGELCDKMDRLINDMEVLIENHGFGPANKGLQRGNAHGLGH